MRSSFHARDLWSDIRARRLSELRQRVLASLGAALIVAATSLLVVNVGFLFDQTLTPLDQYASRSSSLRSVQSATVLGRLPVPVPYPCVEGFDLVLEHERTGSSYGRIYLLGELREGGGFPGYYLIASLFKVPLAAQLILVAALLSMAWRPRLPNLVRGEAVLLLPVVFFTIYFNFFYRAQIGIRYFLVVFPCCTCFRAGCSRTASR